MADQVSETARNFATVVEGYRMVIPLIHTGLLSALADVMKSEFPGLTPLQYKSLAVLMRLLAAGATDTLDERALRAAAAAFALENVVAEAPVLG